MILNVCVSLWYFVPVLAVILWFLYSSKLHNTLNFMLPSMKFASWHINFSLFVVIVSVHFLFLKLIGLTSVYTVQPSSMCFPISCFLNFAQST